MARLGRRGARTTLAEPGPDADAHDSFRTRGNWFAKDRAGRGDGQQLSEDQQAELARLRKERPLLLGRRAFSPVTRGEGAEPVHPAPSAGAGLAQAGPAVAPRSSKACVAVAPEHGHGDAGLPRAGGTRLAGMGCQ
jgi:hypothetical protein